jgi:pyruvate,water dikinase
MDVAVGDVRMVDRPEVLLGAIVKLADRRAGAPFPEDDAEDRVAAVEALEQRLFDAVGPRRRSEAEEVLDTGRLSWRLRDDDNLLLGRVESQLLRAASVAARRLRASGRLAAGWEPEIESAPQLARALQDESVDMVSPSADSAASSGDRMDREAPRQLVGQPAAQGLATGRVRVVVGVSGMTAFVPGEVMVCDAIQPTMTHLVPLASAIVERRGGMLIHGAIIARELAIPCVNGVENAATVLRDGEIVTVDGYLGIVTVGPPAFGLEGVDLGDLPAAPTD